MMQQHTYQSEPNSHTTSLPAHLTTAAETRIDACIRRVMADTLSGQSRERQEELLQEARAQLHAMIAAYEEMGSTTEEALAAALQAFQQEQEVARVRPLAVRSGSAEGQRQVRALALKYFGGATVMLAAILFATGDAINYDRNSALVSGFYLLLPSAAGLGVGLLAPTRPVRSVLGALCRLYVPTVLMYALWASLQRFGNPLYVVSLIGLLHAISWMLFGSVSAGMGGLCRRAAQKLTIASTK